KGYLFRLDMRGLDDLAPFFNFSSNQLGEVGGTPTQYRAAQARKPRANVGIFEAGIDLTVEQTDYFRGGFLRSANSLPAGRFVTGQVFAHRRNGRQNVEPRGARDRKRTQRATPDVFDRFGQWTKVNLDVPGQQVRDRRCAATVRHMDHFDAGPCCTSTPAGSRSRSCRSTWRSAHGRS